MLGGAWTAAGFVPFDVWLGGAVAASQHLIGMLWLLMGVMFLWVPIRFLVVGRSVTSLFPRESGERLFHASVGGIALRFLTWVVSCAAVGTAFSLALIVLGYEEGGF